jgi:hypothetical protein
MGIRERRRRGAGLGLLLFTLGSCTTPGTAVEVARPPAKPLPSVKPLPPATAPAPPPVAEPAPSAEKQERGDAKCVSGPGTGTIRGKVAFADKTVPATFSGHASRSRPGWRYQGECDHPLEDFPLAGGAAGQFVFEGLPPGIYDLTLFGAGLVDLRVDPFVVEAGQVKDVGALVLDRGRTLRGRVLGAGGAPVAGASIHAGEDVWGNEKGFLAISPGPIKTGPDGRFTVPALGRGALVVVADHPSLGRSAALRLAAGNPDMTADLPLLSTGALAGTVMYAGKPAPADVTARPVGLGRAVTLTVGTDAEGRYRFERLAEGAYVVTAQLVRGNVHALAHPARAGQASIAAGKEAGLDLAIPVGSLLVMKAKVITGAADTVTATLVGGTFSAKTDGEMERALDGLDLERARQEHTHLSEKAEIELTDVPAGSYTLCGSATRYIDTRAEIEARAVTCSAIVVAAGGKRREVTLSVAGR